MRWNVGGKRERRNAEKGTAGEGICERERVSEMVVEGWGTGFREAGGWELLERRREVSNRGR